MVSQRQVKSGARKGLGKALARISIRITRRPKMLAYTSALLTFAPAPLNPSCGGGAAVRSSAQPTPTMAVDLEALAKSQNPVLGY